MNDGSQGTVFRALLSCIFALGILAIVPEAQAFNFYSDLNSGGNSGTGGCADCHTAFRKGGNYTSPGGGGAWNDTLHNGHLNNTGVGSNCDHCHGGTGSSGRGVNLSSSAVAADGANALACSGCHGRAADTVGNPNTSGAGWGAGLRQHHWRTGTTLCGSCHEDADPANFTPAGEDTMAPWFATFGLDPCGDDFIGTTLGLDNDGDTLYDSADPDCTAPVCGDGTPTGTEECDPPNASPDGCCAGDCSFEPNAAACNNLTVCDGPDECDGAGNCVNVGPPLDCDDAEVCTDDFCDPVTGCYTTNNTGPCDDGDACTENDTCSGGSCQSGTPLTCNDSNVCTDDSCDPGTGCVYTNNTVSCEDGDLCNGAETCGGGTCNPGTPVTCNPTNECYDVACNPGTGNCDQTLDCSNLDCTAAIEPLCGGCTTNEECDDGLFCNGVETCDIGGTNQCQAGTPPACDDGQYCNGVETCNEATDSCDAGTPPACDDGQYCNGAETCNEATDSCDAGTPPACNNGDYCDGVETCNEATDSCDPGTPINCDNGLYCDGAEVCNETSDSCDPGTPVACDDGQYCNGLETCNEATDSCNSGTPVTCDDGVGCTDDSCNEATDSCDSVINGANCPDDGTFCNGTEFCDPVNDCSSTGDPCTPGSETCNETTDTCDAVTCLDNDGDGYGSPGDPSCPNGGQADCDDTNPAVHPGASEICDGIDTNCDGNLPALENDADGDGHPICAGDCDDNDNTRYPGATEICDGKDNDCAAGIPVNERDTDGDGVKICDVPSDCNDYDASISPNNSEVCGDGKDNNCDGTVDEVSCICPDGDGDGYTASVCGGTDCNDTDAAINPAATEVCDDNIDNDCDGVIDCADGDCAADASCLACNAGDADGDTYSTVGGACGPIDCDDTDPAVNPGASEVCDGKDTNCDGYQSSTDVDADGDGHAVCAGDCADNDASRYPGATEICDGKDNDCVGGVPMNERDNDADGVMICDVPSDCNDYDATISPNASEVCGDGVDNNCNGTVDEAGCVCPDNDGDTYTAAVCGGTDCNDANPAVNPGASEICDDGIDNNCDGQSDCADAACAADPGCATCAGTDLDGDGYSTLGGACGPVDCDDTDPNVNPGEKEICDGKDTNCDGSRKATDYDNDGDGQAICAGDCNDNDPTIYKNAPEICDGKDNDCRGGIPVNERDNDGDGVKVCDVPSDCDDYNAAISPNAGETCGDGIDNNCNGTVDEAGCDCPDNDGDGHTAAVCGGTDCNDADPAVNPGASEVCNDGLDNNCDGQSDCADGTCSTDPDCTVCAAGDLDGDGYSTAGGNCGPIDCDDTDPAVYPGAAEICDGKDNNCDGYQSSTDVDNDGDGYAICAGDCNDADPNTYPGAPELCDGLDNDCVSGIPANERDVDADGYMVCENDCNDSNAAVNPGAAENSTAPANCSDGIDNDCDGLTDTGDPGCSDICIDNDGDGYGVIDRPTCPNAGDDCDDNDPNTHPGAVEVCDGKDNDCVGGIPANEADSDMDTFRICDGDCDDNNINVRPGAPELCDGLDNDCVGGVPANEADVDADTYRICDGDCADNDPAVNPGATEGPFGDPTCSDTKDNDCDGQTDGADAACVSTCVDGDGDGYGSPGDASCPNGAATDCNDTDPAINPAATDTNCNGVDENCSGVADEGYVSTPSSCGDGVCAATGQLECQSGVEVDTCTPGAPSEATDVTCDGLDGDCDGAVDEDYASVGTNCGQGVCAATGATSCVAGVEQDSCAPGAPSEATDVTCDGLDGDCDGAVDEDYVSVSTNCGQGVCAATGATSCVAGVEQDSCAPGAPTETPEVSCSDTLDNDCDGLTDGADGDCIPTCTDGDGDGYGNPGDASCPNGAATDCNDADPAINPGATDTNCNGVDENCSGVADEGYVTTPTSCGDGVCASTGQLECQSGVEVDSCTPGPQDELLDVTCDGLDGDCDGAVDEDYSSVGTNCGQGVCAATGSTSCVGGVEVDSCTPGAPAEATDVTCDGLDGDCDGAVDEDYTSVSTNCGQGVCAATGATSCVAGVEQDSCAPGAPTETPEVSCSDTLDNDCDGLTDGADGDCVPACNDVDGDGYGNPGDASCPNGAATDCNDADPAINPGATDTNCNGVDENCSGAADEGYVTTPTNCGQGVCAATGQLECQSGVEVDTCTPGTPTETPEATCNDGLDNDCDGLIDALDTADCSGTIDYETQIQADIFTPNCALGSCHSGASPKKNLTLEAGLSCDSLYTNNEVVPGDRNASQLYQKVSTGSMADELTPAQAELIGQWIDQGAVCGGGGTCTDNDGDGYGSPGDASCPNGAAEDCNDADPTINPGATENCSDGVDNDCDGLTDGADPECSGATYDYTTDIQPIFTANCALVACHSTLQGTKPKKNLNLEEPASQSWDNLVPTGRVVPGDRNASLLYQKIAPGGSMSDELTPAEAEMIGVWIDEGANP